MGESCNSSVSLCPTHDPCTFWWTTAQKSTLYGTRNRSTIRTWQSLWSIQHLGLFLHCCSVWHATCYLNLLWLPGSSSSTTFSVWTHCGRECNGCMHTCTRTYLYTYLLTLVHVLTLTPILTHTCTYTWKPFCWGLSCHLAAPLIF